MTAEKSRYLKGGHRPDYFLAATIFVLVVGGLVILASASSEVGRVRFDDSYYYLKRQILYGLSFGILGFFTAFKLHYQHYKKVAFLLLLANLGLLALVFTPMGVTTGGATRWIRLGPLTFQPSEFLKLTFVLYLAAWLTNPAANRAKDLKEGFIPFLVMCGVIASLLFFQPATSMVVILLAAGGAVYFMSGAGITHVFITAILGAAAIGLLVAKGDYRLARITSFLNPSADTEDSGFQARQARITIGSGGWWGIGYGQSTTKGKTLPGAHDDAIFAVAAQELGFAGASAIAIFFGILVVRLLWLARKFRDRFGQLILVGFVAIITLQSVVHIGAISGLLPLTGVPLPFVSYGGTALAVFLTMSGIALNISKYT